MHFLNQSTGKSDRQAINEEQRQSHSTRPERRPSTGPLRSSAVPTQIVIELAPEEQVRFLAELRRARRGRWLALHILLLLARSIALRVRWRPICCVPVPPCTP
jgi:hypothetical protein